MACQRILVGATIDLFAYELLGGGVGHGTHGHVGLGKSADFVDGSGDAEVGQQDPLLASSTSGQHDVGWFDIAVQ